MDDLKNKESYLQSLIKEESNGKSNRIQCRGILANSKKRIKNICNSLSIPTNKYDPKKTVISIICYLRDKQKVDRILYSDISNYLYSLEEEARGIFTSNIDTLLNYVIDDDVFNIENFNCEFENLDDCKKLIIKIYDHSNLVNNQIENYKNIIASNLNEIRTSFEKQIEQKQENFNKQIKDTEKEYVAILGIFAAIVFAFTGVFTFSTSIFENINQGSMYRIVFIILLIALIFSNLIFGLFYWIEHIVNKKSKNEDKKDTKSKHDKVFIFSNTILLFLMLFVFFLWKCGFIENRNHNINNSNSNQIIIEDVTQNKEYI